MAVLSNTYLNLIDVFSRTEDGKVAANIIEMLKQSNPILDDAIAMECNMGTKHRHTIRTGLPEVTWGRLYQGIVQSKSQVQQVDDTTGWVESMSAVDERLLKLSKNAAAIRLSEAAPHMEAMNQEMATGIFYHDTATTPEKFKGLAARFNTLSTSGAGRQIIDAGGSGSDNTSIWFVTWADDACHLLYPEGTKAGIQREDMGRQRVTDENGNPYYVLEEKFEWHIGMAVKDWRYVVRIANIDVSELAAGNVDLYKFMRAAYWRLQNRRQVKGSESSSGRRIAIYANRDVLEALDGLSTNGTGGTGENSFLRLTTREIEGREVLVYREMPLRETDAIVNTEARVV